MKTVQRNVEQVTVTPAGSVDRLYAMSDDAFAGLMAAHRGLSAEESVALQQQAIDAWAVRAAARFAPR